MPPPPTHTNSYTAAVKLAYIKLTTYSTEYSCSKTSVHKITDVPVLDLMFSGPNGNPFALCHFRAQKSLDFQGPPLPITFKMDLLYQNH